MSVSLYILELYQHTCPLSCLAFSSRLFFFYFSCSLLFVRTPFRPCCLDTIKRIIFDIFLWAFGFLYGNRRWIGASWRFSRGCRRLFFMRARGLACRVFVLPGFFVPTLLGSGLHFCLGLSPAHLWVHQSLGRSLVQLYVQLPYVAGLVDCLVGPFLPTFYTGFYASLCLSRIFVGCGCSGVETA